MEDPFCGNSSMILVNQAADVNEYGTVYRVRQSHSIMDPHFGLYNHSNVRCQNTLVVAELFQKFQVYTRMYIVAGGQIYHSYSDESDMEVFREYGFV